MCAHQRIANVACNVAGSPPETALPAALAMNAPGITPNAATW